MRWFSFSLVVFVGCNSAMPAAEYLQEGPEIFSLSFRQGNVLVVYNYTQFTGEAPKEEITFSSPELAGRVFVEEGKPTTNYPDSFTIIGKRWEQNTPSQPVEVSEEYKELFQLARSLARRRWDISTPSGSIAVFLPADPSGSALFLSKKLEKYENIAIALYKRQKPAWQYQFLNFCELIGF